MQSYIDDAKVEARCTVVGSRKRALGALAGIVHKAIQFRSRVPRHATQGGTEETRRPGDAIGGAAVALDELCLPGAAALARLKQKGPASLQALELLLAGGCNRTRLPVRVGDGHR
jgi:hypothetical protein